MGWKFGFGSDLWATLRKFLDERREPRAELRVHDAILTLGGRDHPVQVSNLSRSGAMIVFAGSASVGDRILLRLLDQGPKAGQVRWVRNGQVGISFAGGSE